MDSSKYRKITLYYFEHRYQKLFYSDNFVFLPRLKTFTIYQNNKQ